ncbi:MAG: hypothetical protein HDT21_02725 [Ruminococcus sp.]|nr:hypothetical protein [Ruminococcus sp.]
MNDMRLRARGGDFAACGRRPKGSALWTSASWAQLDQLMSAASPPEKPHDSALNQNLSPYHNSIKITAFTEITTASAKAVYFFDKKQYTVFRE